jgi:RNA polymerase sigma-70 factor (ECF subfamily)
MLAEKQEKLFKQWFGEHKGLVFKVVKAYAASPQDQDDLFQEILLQLWSSIPVFQGKAKEATWIYRVALNTALVWRRGETRKRKRYHKLIIDFNGAPDIQQSSCNPMRDSQILDQLYGAIRQLSKIDSSVVLMYLDGVSYDEMAGILGISKSNVGVKLNRAKKQLAQLLKGIIDDF